MSEAAREVWPTVRSIPVSAVTDAKLPGHLRPARVEAVAGSGGTGRDTAGGAVAGRDQAGTGRDTTEGARTRRDPAGGAGSGRDAAGMGRETAGGRRATGVGTAGAKPRGTHARQNPAAELGFSGDPGQHGDDGDGMLHAQRIWDASLATSRLDDLGVNTERQRVETAEITTSVGLLVDGRPEDVQRCVQSLIDHTRARVLVLDLGNVDGAGNVLDDLARRWPERMAAWHVAERPHWRGGTATWGESRAKLLRLDESEVHVLMETTTVLRGDALTPLIAAVAEGAVAAGWWGAEPLDDGRSWREAGPGPVRALRGDLMAVRRSAAIGALPEHAHHGANADLELSLALHGTLVVPRDRPPVERHDRDDLPGDYLERESRRNYDGVLRLLHASA
ncbi:hypothetical protein E1267_13495 [Nonomuraea longispora]|uniref:Uncharacterized protein n=1 Tax=Nonomuraea longispora TaxID=1848320 RepID=A0A4R4NE06_9ACTN|nr:hypothetical protein [Nonomuraea longispora]TDC07351.1 hypothetical protein E1267_13495 [Nonomuraea longispora]